MHPHLPPIILKKGEDRRLRAGHDWIFSNEVDTQRSPLDRYAPGDGVLVQAASGRPLGRGYVNPHSLISVRLVTRDARLAWDRTLIDQRLAQAFDLRRRLFSTPYYRLVYGESDGLPGLIVDCYGDTLIAQFNTAGMEVQRTAVLAALDALLAPRGILLRNDGSARDLEGLPRVVEVGAGTVTEEVEIEENGARFLVPMQGGQKTGWYFDHRANRAAMRDYVRDASVLDVFCYHGGWGIEAAVAGAREVLCIDSSAVATAQVERNAIHNAVADRVRTMTDDAFAALKALCEDGRRFDVVLVDPPAFIKRRKDFAAGTEAYRRLNGLALQLVEPGGFLISSSCSAHLSRADFVDLLRATALHADRTLRIVAQGHQAADHPVHPAMPETEYLKCFVCRVQPGV